MAHTIEAQILENLDMAKRLAGRTNEQIGAAVPVKEGQKGKLSGEAFRHRLTGRSQIKAWELHYIAKSLDIPIQLFFLPRDQFLKEYVDRGFPKA
jgi:hypothetical protein